MADENENSNSSSDEGGGEAAAIKCPPCTPGLPGWMATFSDLVTLLLTFFVLLLSFAKTESAKYEAALGSIRSAFGGNVLQHGEVIQRGKSPDDSPTMLDSQEPIRPFPIDFLTMEGILDKHEINRESDEDLNNMKEDLREFELADEVDVYEVSEGIKVKIKENILFKKGSIEVDPGKVNVKVFQRITKLLSDKKWVVFVSGHASRGEVSTDNSKDSYQLSSARAIAVTKSLVRRGVPADRITTVFYGDTRPNKISGVDQGKVEFLSRRVEFLLRKRDLNSGGHKVDAK